MHVIAFVIIVSAAAMLVAVANLAEENPHRLAWMVGGLAGAPAVGIGLVYVFGVPFIVAAFALGIVVSVNRQLEKLSAAIYALGFVAAAVYEASRFDETRALRIGILLFLASAFVALYCITALGRAIAITAWRMAHHQ